MSMETQCVDDDDEVPTDGPESTIASNDVMSMETQHFDASDASKVDESTLDASTVDSSATETRTFDGSVSGVAAGSIYEAETQLIGEEEITDDQGPTL
jgi:hypothetical protein